MAPILGETTPGYERKKKTQLPFDFSKIQCVPSFLRRLSHVGLCTKTSKERHLTQVLLESDFITTYGVSLTSQVIYQNGKPKKWIDCIDTIRNLVTDLQRHYTQAECGSLEFLRVISDVLKMLCGGRGIGHILQAGRRKVFSFRSRNRMKNIKS